MRLPGTNMGRFRYVRHRQREIWQLQISCWIMARMHQHKTTMGRLHCHQALSEGHVDLAEFLLDKGADLTAQAEDGWTWFNLPSSDGAYSHPSGTWRRSNHTGELALFDLAYCFGPDIELPLQ